VLCGGTGLYLDAALRGYRLVEVPENLQFRRELADKSDEELTLLLQQLVPNQHNTSNLTDRIRTIRALEIAQYEALHTTEIEPFPEIRPLVIGIRWERSELKRRITERLKARLAAGMIEEVQHLHESGVAWERLDYYGLEYRFVAAFLQGNMSRNDMFQKLNAAIHDFAKRQETWFRRMEKNGVLIHWINGTGDVVAEALELI
jgi:tRNA dimethylallyltransferase